MTEPTTATDASETPDTATMDTTPDVDTGPDSAETPDTVREAKKYRQRAQAAEAERDALATRLETLQRAEVERLAAQHLSDGADLWRDGAQLAELLNDDGNIDPDKIAGLTKQLTAAHPHWRKMIPAAPPASTVTANGKITAGEEPPTWSDLLKGRNNK